MFAKVPVQPLKQLRSRKWKENRVNRYKIGANIKKIVKLVKYMICGNINDFVNFKFVK